MAAPHPTTPRPRTPHTTPTPTRPYSQPRHTRRWGRLLVLVLTVTLVATLGTRALADDGNDGSFFGPFGEAPGSQSDSAQGQTQPDQPSADAAPNPDSSSGGTSQLSTAADRTTDGGDSRQTPTPAAASQDQQQAAQPPGEQHDLTATVTQDDHDQATQDDSHGTPATCSGGSPCSPEPATPRNFAAAGPPSWDDPGEEDWDDPDDLEDGEAADASPRTMDENLDQLQENIEWVERIIQEIRDRPDQRAEGGKADLILQLDGPDATVAESRADMAGSVLGIQLDVINIELAPQLAGDTARLQRLNELRAKAEEAQRQLQQLADELTVRHLINPPPPLEPSPDPESARTDLQIASAERSVADYVEREDRAGLEHILHNTIGGDDGLDERVERWADPERYAKVQALKQKIQDALDRLPGGSAMSMVVSKDVGAGQQPTHNKPAAPPNTPGFTPPPQLPTQTVSPATAPKLPHNTGHTPTKLNQRPLTSQQEESEQTSEQWERFNQAGRTTTKVLTYLTAGAFGLYVLTQYVLAGIAGLVPREVLQNAPGMSPRPTQG